MLAKTDADKSRDQKVAEEIAEMVQEAGLPYDKGFGFMSGKSIEMFTNFRSTAEERGWEWLSPSEEFNIVDSHWIGVAHDPDRKGAYILVLFMMDKEKYELYFPNGELTYSSFFLLSGEIFLLSRLFGFDEDKDPWLLDVVTIRSQKDSKVDDANLQIMSWEMNMAYSQPAMELLKKGRR